MFFNTNEIDVSEKINHFALKLKAKFTWLTDLFLKNNQFDKLSEEIISEIIKHLDKPNELIILSNVSCRFNKICNDKKIWQHFGFASKKEYLELLKIRKKGLTITTIGNDGLYSTTQTMKSVLFKQMDKENNNHPFVSNYSYSVLGWNFKINNCYTYDADIILVLPDNLHHFDEICREMHDDLMSPTSNKHYFFMVVVWGYTDIVKKIENLLNSHVHVIPCITDRWGETILTKTTEEILKIILSKVISAEKFQKYQMIHNADCHTKKIDLLTTRLR